jgi:DNA topoisomerase-1
VSDRPVVVRDGRFGPYVSDGEYNATLRKGDSVEAMTLERAAELLADKRASGPAPKRRTAKSATKSATAKKSTAKKATPKRSAAKKTAAAAAVAGKAT